jgi:hypothetical protein
MAAGKLDEATIFDAARQIESPAARGLYIQTGRSPGSKRTGGPIRISSNSRSRLPSCWALQEAASKPLSSFDWSGFRQNSGCQASEIWRIPPVE